MTRRARAAWIGGALALAAAGGALAYYAVQARQASQPALPTAKVPASWRQYRSAPGHEAHVKQEGIECRACHDVDHGFAPRGMQACAGCHEPEARIEHATPAAGAGETPLAECTACHAFGPHAVQDASDCNHCHEQPQGELTAVDVHAREACAKCHRPHEDPAIEPMACLGCHPTAQNRHPAVAREERAHAGGAGTQAHAAAGTHAAVPPAAHEPANCLTCHGAHELAERAAERCRDCHDLPHALRPGHDACTSCHEPHGFARAEVKDCRGCHQDQPVLAAASAPAHALCTSCHAPHAVRGSAETACKTCHAKVSPDHPAVQGHLCTSCHDPHPQGALAAAAARRARTAGRRAATAVACTSCHELAPDDGSAHAGKAQCTQCHEPHAFAHPRQDAACSDCHAPEITATAVNAGHDRCLACHEGHPHDAELRARACTSCHAQVHTRKEHAQCTQCHEPHSGMPGIAQSCARCHAAEHRSTLKVHRDCATCHTAHEGALRPSARCEHCHARKAAENHGALAQGCGACHGVHARAGVLAAPSCTSCHQAGTLPGLHAEPAHRECGKCHEGAHDEGPFSERATCVSCHAKQRDHVPEAQLCQGCHVFAR